MVAVTGEPLLLVAENEPMLPAPVAGRPIDVVLLVQL